MAHIQRLACNRVVMLHHWKLAFDKVPLLNSQDPAFSKVDFNQCRALASDVAVKSHSRVSSTSCFIE